MHKLAQKLGTILLAAAFVAVAAASLLGALRPVDDALRDLRFEVQSRGTTGSVVFIDIDSKSLESVGVWPWPRHIHAELIDRLMALGADDVVFDVDFSVRSDPAEDAVFAAALERAGGYAHLAAFQQQRTGDGPASFNLPNPAFAKYADPVAVNVRLDDGGLVRTYPFAMSIGGKAVPSAASLLADVRGPAGSGFDIDYSIDPGTIARISAADLLAGKVDASRIAGKQVIIGASAVELRDYFVVPRFGILPGALLQALATETLRQHRALQPMQPWPMLLAVLAIGLVTVILRRRAPLLPAVSTALIVSLSAEGIALVLQIGFALLADTAAIHVATVMFAISVLLAELVKRGQQKRAADERLRYLSAHDPLTGAYSRLRLTELIAAASDRDVAVVLIDLRRFRLINDTLGHSQGDLLLKQVVQRLMAIGPDAVARLGGDSFAVLAPGMSPDKLRGYCQSVAQWITSPYQLANGHQAIIAATAGATTSEISGHDPEALLSHADMALSAAKHVPGNGVALFEPAMDARMKERSAMDGALRRGLLERQFTLAYQPQIELATGRMVGVEALARWRDIDLGPVSPLRFISAAEETGLIVELGRWVLNAACRDATVWPPHLKLAVNVSPVQFELSDVVQDVADALHASGLPPGQLEIEITEGIFVKNFEAMSQRLMALRALGVGIALDDFGTGYSSLSYLGELPIDKLKIDQSFVKRLPEDKRAEAITDTVIRLAKVLHKDIIAEGIETAEQARILKAMGCTQAQGFYFGRPMSGADLMSGLQTTVRVA